MNENDAPLFKATVAIKGLKKNTITDEKGRKTAAVIDLNKHGALWEDIEDVLVSRSRQRKKRIPLDKVKADLIKRGRLRG